MAEAVPRLAAGESAASIGRSTGAADRTARDRLRPVRAEARRTGAGDAWDKWQGDVSTWKKTPLEQVPLPPASSWDFRVETPMREQEWIARGSWTHCPDCGRVRADGKIDVRWLSQRRKPVTCKCSGGCDKRPIELGAQVPTDDDGRSKLVSPAGDTLKAYVTPRHGEISEDEVKRIRRELEIQVDDADPRAAFPTAAETMDDWPDVLLDLADDEVGALAPLDIKVEFKTVRGGRASIKNRQKTHVVRAVWKRQSVAETVAASPQLHAAYTWLMQNNATYAHYIGEHNRLLQEHSGDATAEWRWVRTCDLLLHMPGVEVAARPWLYPRPAFGDSDLKRRLVELGRIGERSKPSMKASWVRKLTSKVSSYQADFPLFCLLHDIALAKQISSVVAVAKDKGIAPDEAANHMQNFGAFWVRETHKLEDICRQRGLPNLFWTVAPAEWKFPLHEGMFYGHKKMGTLEDRIALLTVHMYHVLSELIEEVILPKGERPATPECVKKWEQTSFDAAAGQYEKLGAKHTAGERITGAVLKDFLKLFPAEVQKEFKLGFDVGEAPTQDRIKTVLEACREAIRVRAGWFCIKKVHDFCFRFEYQGRGTLHVHVLAWVDYDVSPSWQGSLQWLTGRTSPPTNRSSPMVRYLERMFGSSVDVQCKEGSACLLRYVAGYVSKQSDALVFNAKEWQERDAAGGTTAWRQIYRLLCKKAPLEPEMAVEFTSAQLMKASFRGTTLHAQIPGNRPRNDSRDCYNTYLAKRSPESIESYTTFGGDLSFIEFARKYQHHVDRDPVTGEVLQYTATPRGQRGRGSNKELCAVGVQFPFELLDIYIGAWCSTFVPHRRESDLHLLPRHPSWDDASWNAVEKRRWELSKMYEEGQTITEGMLKEFLAMHPQDEEFKKVYKMEYKFSEDSDAA